jgi:hypothetical protein
LAVGLQFEREIHMKRIFITVCFFTLIVFGCRKDKNAIIEESELRTKDYLSDQRFDKLKLEIVYKEGYKPQDATIDALVALLNARLNKPAGIEVIRKSVASSGPSIYSLQDIKNIEKTNRAEFTSSKTLAAYAFFADGDFNENSGGSKVLGIAYGFSSVVIFEKTIQEISGGLTQPSRATVETSVLNHEFGHLLGLVNNGTSMTSAHQDEPHGRHCNNKACLMYYAAETNDLIGNLINNKAPELDENCLNDLRANGGK